GDEKSYLFGVTSSSISTFELPRRSEIEAAAQRAYEALTARNRTITRETSLQKQRRIQAADAEYPKTAAALSQMLLGPVAEDLKTRRLVIVAEGVLQYLPFATLPEPSSPRNQTHAPAGTDRDSSTVDHPPLVVEHEIVTLPSASVLAVLRQELGSRKHADAKIAVLA